MVIKISSLTINIVEMKKNLNFYKSKLNKNQKICLVGKANCYGYGEKICKYFNDLVDFFAVSSEYEFFRLKKLVSKPIIILDTIYNEKVLKKLILRGAEITISNEQSLDVLLKLEKNINSEIKVHIAINTGMNRFGFSSILSLYETITKIKNSKKIKIYGVFSHYFNGKCDKTSQKQLKKFIKYAKFLQKEMEYPVLLHICASDGSIFNNYGDMVRLGYGIYDNSKYDTITLKTNILDFQYLKAMESAGYNEIFTAKKDTKIAIIGIGYGDGLPRNIVGKGYVLINDHFAKIVASCMDSMLVDVTDIDCKLNDEVIIIGKGKKNKISICDVANFCDTIGYEIIVRLSHRINRIYLGENKCKSLRGNIEEENL